MTHDDRLRRRLLSDAVRDNRDLRRGGGRPAQRASRLRARALRVYRTVVGPTLLFVGITVVSTGVSDWRGTPNASLAELSARLAFSTSPAINTAALSLGVRRIVLDPGHGGSDPGAQGTQSLREKDITLEVARRLRTLLEDSSFGVVLTRQGDHTVSLEERIRLANHAAADLFVSIHVNAIRTPQRCGVESYYVGPTDDPAVAAIAHAENRESGYSLADVRRLLERVYVHLRQDESRQLAGVVQRGVTAFLSKTDAEVKDNGVKTAPLIVLAATEMPAILAEIGCLSNEDEARLLLDPRHLQNIARGLFVGIRAYADARNRWAGTGSL